ncbi:MAG: hypothetical protein GX267_04230 [Fibrobacter sp.]|jgi:hypothetical protein|nr:hypothetical protein [Fibrobacter sp.]
MGSILKSDLFYSFHNYNPDIKMDDHYLVYILYSKVEKNNFVVLEGGVLKIAFTQYFLAPTAARLP